MDYGIRGRIAVVTGAASGIGLATARMLAAEGARVVMSDQYPSSLQTAADRLRDTVAEGGGDVAPLPANLDARRKLLSAGTTRPVHDSGHRRWNEKVEDSLRNIEENLSTEGLTRGTEVYARRARQLLEQLQDKLREKMKAAHRLTLLDLTPREPPLS